MQSRIKELRERLGMSQEELANKAGISRVTLSGLETGTVESTSTKTLFKIAAALNSSVDEVFIFT